MTQRSFEECCELLPEGVCWGDSITPRLVQEIAEAALLAERERVSRAVQAEIERRRKQDAFDSLPDDFEVN